MSAELWLRLVPRERFTRRLPLSREATSVLDGPRNKGRRWEENGNGWLEWS